MYTAYLLSAFRFSMPCSVDRARTLPECQLECTGAHARFRPAALRQSPEHTLRGDLGEDLHARICASSLLFLNSDTVYQEV